MKKEKCTKLLKISKFSKPEKQLPHPFLYTHYVASERSVRISPT